MGVLDGCTTWASWGGELTAQPSPRPLVGSQASRLLPVDGLAPEHAVSPPAAMLAKKMLVASSARRTMAVSSCAAPAMSSDGARLWHKFKC